MLDYGFLSAIDLGAVLVLTYLRLTKVVTSPPKRIISRLALSSSVKTRPRYSAPYTDGDGPARTESNRRQNVSRS